mgnify:CR=1 FL=1
MVRQVFTEEGIPQDLAYLAVIESGYQNHARSYAAAVGMWQFIRSTGRIYGPLPIRFVLAAWVEVTRGTPVLLQLFVLYYGLSGFVRLPAFLAAIEGFGALSPASPSLRSRRLASTSAA